MRLFAAVRPSDDALAHLERALDAVRGGPGGRPRGGLRWTPPQDRHVTLAFYGEVPEGFLDELAADLAGVAAATAPFAATLAGAGVFDSRTLWVGCTGDGWGPLMTAAGRVGAELLGRPADGRNRPHLTVARTGRARPAGRRGGDRRGSRDGAGARSGAVHPGAGDPEVGRPEALAHALALYRDPDWPVREVELVASRLGAGPGGTALHTVVHVAAVGAVAG